MNVTRKQNTYKKIAEAILPVVGVLKMNSLYTIGIYLFSEAQRRSSTRPHDFGSTIKLQMPLVYISTSP
jgi:hypothetical protein